MSSEIIGRREFVISASAVGGSLMLGVAWHDAEAATKRSTPLWGSPNKPSVPEFSPWLTIAPDDTVTVRVPTPEIGNGVMTQYAMTVSEELHSDWSKMRVEFASTLRNVRENKVYSKPAGRMAYFSGRSTGPERMEVLLQVGASARERLKAAAAKRWGVDVAELTTKDGVIRHTSSGRTLRYGEVAAEAAQVKLPAEPKPKASKDWTLLGKKKLGKITNASIVNGTAVYGIDVRLPGMLYAALMQSPVHGGKLKSVNFDAVKNMPGVRGIAIVDPSEKRPSLEAPFPIGQSAPQSAVAIVADHYWQARKALEALPVKWDDGPGAKWKSTQQMVDAAVAALDKEGDKVEVGTGDALGAFKKGGRIVEATYVTPYCDQTPLEPLNGTALVTPERVQVWHPSQHSEQAFIVAADEAGVSPEKVEFYQTMVGGGFGRRVFGDDVRMVVAVARKFPGRPVHVIWSREESMRQGRYRALQAGRFRAVLDSKGMPAALHVRVAGDGFSTLGLADTPYANARVIPNVQIESKALPFHVLTGPYRGPGYNSNSFMVESFIDECAVAAGIDPLEYRLRLLERWPDAGWTKCLREAAAKAGWGRKLPRGQGQGIAIANWGMGGKPEHGTTVATVATVQVTEGGELKVLQVDVAFDTGTVLNREAVLVQLQGGTIFGLNMTLNEELNVENGRIVEGNFDSYPMLRTGDVPRVINVHFGGLSGHSRISEIGEPPVGPIGPAVGAAIFRATGKRLRTTPFRKHDLKFA